MTESAFNIKQLLKLQAKSVSELQALCEGMKLSIEGDKTDLIDRLLATKVNPQFDVMQAQAIPLRTRDNNGKPILAITHIMKDWRKKIFNASNNVRQFQLLNGKGEPYKVNLKFMHCRPEVAQTILNKEWFLPVSQQRNLISLIRQDPSKFTFAIIQKPDKSGNSWIMLHVQPN